MYHKQKGFTLIELLAVIVVLAIIALIAVPLVLGAIKNAKIGALKASGYNILEAAYKYKILHKIDQDTIMELPDDWGKLSLKNNFEHIGQVVTKNNGTQYLVIYDEKENICLRKDYNQNEIKEVEVEDAEECYSISATQSGMIFDGWITLNLFYPENSTDQKWRVGEPGEVREEDWNDYEGSITIPLQDVEKVYIKYKVAGKVTIIPPKGTVYVDIEPSSYTLKTGGKITFQIYSNGDSIYYKKGSEWIEYKSGDVIEWTDLGYIEAKAIKNENVYRTDGEIAYTRKITSYDSVYINTPDGPGLSTGGSGGSSSGIGTPTCPDCESENIANLPSYYLYGPNIEVTPTDITTHVNVKITTQKQARKIYYMVGSGSYKEYTGEFSVGKNATIYAYYITEEEGQTSSTSRRRISNIRYMGNGCELPYVSLKVSSTRKATSVNVELLYEEGNPIYYSYNGVEYYDYIDPLVIKDNRRIYAKSKNTCGESIEYVDVTNILGVVNGIYQPLAPAPKQNLSVIITQTPNTNNYVDSVTISIDYDSKASKKYYKIGSGNLLEYTEPFIVDDNETIYAYALSDNGYGEDYHTINNIGIDAYTPKGISAPIIIASPDNSVQAQSVSIEIKYDEKAESKKYRIGNGNLLEYTGPFTVHENVKISAYSTDNNGNSKTSTYTVSNIKEQVPISILDYGKYYVIKLNYPESSDASTREYKYKENGQWVTYKSDGILLLTKESNIDPTGIIKIVDETGKEKEFKGDYYYIDGSASNIYSDIFMRWDTGVPATPVVILDTTDPAREVNVTIEYDNTSRKKEYMIVNPDGSTTGWMKYKGSFKVTNNNTIIFTRARNISEVYSKTGEYKITNIDEIAPEIKIAADFISKTQKLSLRVNVIDDVMVDTVMYTKGNVGVSYFKTNGKTIQNNSIVKIEENGEYTFYAKDGVGNEQVYSVIIDNIDTEAPLIEIMESPDDQVVLETTIEIDYGDSTTKRYKVGINGTYQNYTEPFTITSDYILSKNLQNSDYSLTICAEGKDSVGNINEVCKNIYNLDLDAPNIPVINARSVYPTLKTTGMYIDGRTTINYDLRNDVDNYYSIDGENWIKYTGVFEQTSGVIYAKSVKKGTGLTVQTSKTISMPADALPYEAYDPYIDTSTYLGNTTKYINVDSSTWGQKIVTTKSFSYSRGHLILTYYDENNNKLTDVDGIPIGTAKIEFYGYYCSLFDVRLDTTPVASALSAYPVLTLDGIQEGYEMVTLKYYPTSIQKLYKIDDGEWQEYRNSIKLNGTSTIYAKGIDKNGNETSELTHKSNIPTDALPYEAYDPYIDTSTYLGNTTKYINVDSSTWGQKIVTTKSFIYGHSGATLILTYYDENNNKLTYVDGIPIGTAKIEFYGYYCSLFDVRLDTTPVASILPSYPVLTLDGVKEGYQMVTLKYYPTAIQKLYKIDDGEWQEYRNSIKLYSGSTIYAKGIDKNGNETSASSYTAVLPEDALGPLAYDDIDGDITKETTKGYLYVDPLIQGRNIIIKSYIHRYGWVITFIDVNGHDIETISPNQGINEGGYRNYKLSYPIPMDTHKIYFNIANSGALYDVRLDTE